MVGCSPAWESFAIPRIPLHICSPHSHGELLSLPCPSSHSSRNRFGLKGMRAWQGGFIQDPRSRRSLEFRRGWEMSNPEVRLELRMVVAEGKWNSRLAMIDRGGGDTLACHQEVLMAMLYPGDLRSCGFLRPKPGT